MARNLIGTLGIQASFNYDPGLAVGTGSYKFPTVNPYNFSIGSTLGLLNLVAISAGTATASPASIDLTTLTDPFGTAVSFAKVNAALFLNDSTVDANILLLDGTVANAWKTPFNAITTAKLVIPPGFVGPDGLSYPGLWMVNGLNTTGLAVNGTNKIVSLDPGANTVAYRILWLGR